LDALLSDLLDALCGAGLATEVALLRALDADDVALAEHVFDCREQLRPLGRTIFLITACRWVGEALMARVDRPDEAARWARMATADLERYRDVDSAPGAAAVSEFCGGAL